MYKKYLDKGDPIFGLDKVPDKIIIKQLRVELGQKESYICELEDKLKNIGDPDELIRQKSRLESEIFKIDTFKRLSEKNKEARMEISKLKRENADILNKYIKLLHGK